MAADMPWVKVPTHSAFLTTAPLQSRLTWDQQVCGGTWLAQPFKLIAPADASRIAAPVVSEGDHKSASTRDLCACGNIFLSDAMFCRKCGAKRPELPEAPSSGLELSSSGQGLTSNSLSAWPVPPRQKAGGSSPGPHRSDIELSRDPNAKPSAPWLARPSGGTWLSHSALLATKPTQGSWLRLPPEGRWLPPRTLDVSAVTPVLEDKSFRKGMPPSVPELALTSMKAEEQAVLESALPEEEGSLPPRLVSLRAEARQEEAAVLEAAMAYDSLISQNAALHQELNRLLALASPSDTPPWVTQR